MGFILAFLFFRIVRIAVLCQPPKSRHSPDTSPDNTAEDATVISINRRFSFCCLVYSSCISLSAAECCADSAEENFSFRLPCSFATDMN